MHLKGWSIVHSAKRLKKIVLVQITLRTARAAVVQIRYLQYNTASSYMATAKKQYDFLEWTFQRPLKC